jgi:hypothetical protein
VELDEKHGTTPWVDATSPEMVQLNDYHCFHVIKARVLTFQRASRRFVFISFIYDVNHDGRHKRQLVADGHLTDIPVDSVYSGVVTLCGQILLIFLAELNDLPTWATGICYAYLEALTSEKVCIIAGPEFGNLQGPVMIIYKALYGLCSSGPCWHDRFSDCLCMLKVYSMQG